MEQRDAFLSTARAMASKDPTRVADVDALARGFAKRGLGSHAVFPPRNSTNLNQVVESFVIDTKVNPGFERRAAGGIGG